MQLRHLTKYFAAVTFVVCGPVAFGQEFSTQSKFIIDYAHGSPWVSSYLLFIVPGLVIWIGGLAWCLRKRNIRGAVHLQVLGAVEVVVGSGVAFVVGMTDVGHTIEASGGIDPIILIWNVRFLTQISLIGLLVHIGLLLITGGVIVRIRNKIRQAQQAAT